MKRQARHSVEIKLAEMKREVDGFDPNTVRPSTLRKRLEEYKDLRSRLDLYESSLSMMTEDIKAATTDLERRVAEMIGA